MIVNARILDEIETAFQDVNYPGDKDLVYDQNGQHTECNEIAEVFRGRHWKDLEVSELQSQSAALFFFSQHAYVFFLPAYLRAIILTPEEADTIPGVIVDSLIQCTTSTSHRTTGNRLEWLTSTQRSVVKDVLCLLKTTLPWENILGDIDLLLEKL